MLPIHKFPRLLWLVVKGLSIQTWTRDTFIVITKNFGQLLKIHSSTKELTDKNQAKIRIGCISKEGVSATILILLRRFECMLEISIKQRMAHDSTMYYDIDKRNL